MNNLTQDLKGIAETAARNGWITPPAPKTIVAKKSTPRHTQRRRGANLGVVVVDGRKWVIEFRPVDKLVVRQLHKHLRYEISLSEIVELAQGQHFFRQMTNAGDSNTKLDDILRKISALEKATKEKTQ